MKNTETPTAARAAASVSGPTESTKPPVSIDEQMARWAIDGAIAYGRQGINKPPAADHWLMEYWQIGQQLAKLGETCAWDNVTTVDSAAPVSGQGASIKHDAQFCALVFTYMASGGVGAEGKRSFNALVQHIDSRPRSEDSRAEVLRECAAWLDEHEKSMSGSRPFIWNALQCNALRWKVEYAIRALATGAAADEEPGWSYGRAKSSKPTPKWTEVQRCAEEFGGRVVGNKISFPTSEGKALFDIWYAENAPASLRVRSVFKPFRALASTTPQKADNE